MDIQNIQKVLNDNGFEFIKQIPGNTESYHFAKKENVSHRLYSIRVLIQPTDLGYTNVLVHRGVHFRTNEYDFFHTRLYNNNENVKLFTLFNEGDIEKIARLIINWDTQFNIKDKAVDTLLSIGGLKTTINTVIRDHTKQEDYSDAHIQLILDVIELKQYYNVGNSEKIMFLAKNFNPNIDTDRYGIVKVEDSEQLYFLGTDPKNLTHYPSEPTKWLINLPTGKTITFALLIKYFDVIILDYPVITTA